MSPLASRGRAGLLAGALLLAAAATLGAALARAEDSRAYLPRADRPAQATPPPSTLEPEPFPVTPCPTREPTAAPVSPTLAAPIVVVPRGLEPTEWSADPLKLSAVALAGDTLRLSMTYGGGCWEHDLWLLASSLFMESAPPQADLLLSHEAHGDACRAIVPRSLAFDLGPLKRTAQAGDPAAHGTLILRLRGWPEPLRYDY